MSNTKITSSVIARELLMQFKNALGFTRGANRQYDDRFANKGAQIGKSIDVKLPHLYEVTDGKVVNVQNVTDRTVQLTLNKRKHVAFQFDSEELTLHVDEFSKTHLQPAALALANQVDVDGLQEAALATYNAVGTPGTTPSDIETYLQATQKLNEFACPDDDRRNILINPAAQTKIVKGLSTLQNPQSDVSRQYRRGAMGGGPVIGCSWAMAQNIHTHTVGPLGGTPLVDGASQTGTTLSTKGWTSSAASRLKEGDIFTIDGVNAVNPITKKSTGSLQQFVVTADFSSESDGTGDVSISPEIITSGAYQTVTASPADEAAITVLGAADTETPCNLAYHKDSAILGCADLVIPKGVDMAARASDKESGLSVRFVRYYDGDNDEFISRVDIIYGWLMARPEWMCRIQG